MKKLQYYINQLSSKEKHIYHSLNSGMEYFKTEIALPPVSINTLEKTFERVLRENPLIFYVQSFNVTGNAQGVSFFPHYKISPHKAKRYLSDIKQYLKHFDKARGFSELDKELYVHDFCLDRFKYDYSFGEHAYSVLGLVRNNMAVCEGIAKFVKLALDYLGVNCIVVHGKANDPLRGTREAHTWNIVEIKGQPFHLDVTFDMCLKSNQKRHDYFNLSDEEIQKDHLLTRDFPRCTVSEKDFYTTRKMTVSSPKEFGAYIESRLKNGEKCIIAKLKNVSDATNILAKVMDIAQRKYTNMFNQSSMVEVRFNQSQMVFEIEFM